MFGKHARGFTLMELIIYIALIALIGGAVVQYTMSVGGARNKNAAVLETQAAARTALSMITERIRAAEGVNVASSTFGADPGVLSLQMAESGKNPTVIDLTADDGRLRITEGSATPEVLFGDTVSVTSLVFTDLTSSSLRENIRVQLTVEYANAGDVYFNATTTLQASASVRQ